MIRTMRMNDIEKVIDIGVKHHAESSFSHKNFSRKVTKLTLINLVNQKQGFPLVAEVDDKIVGYILAYVQQDYFGVDNYLAETGMFVDPDSRYRGIGHELIQAFLGLAKQLKLKDVRLAVSSGKIIDQAVNKLCTSNGAEVVGSNYLWRL